MIQGDLSASQRKMEKKMGEKLSKETAEIMDERFGCDTLLSVATVRRADLSCGL